MACNQHQLGLCLSGFTSSSAHHQHQVIFIFSPKLTWAVRIISSFVPVRRQHASSASAGLCLYGGNFGDTHHQHQLGCACLQAVQAMRIISVSWFVLVGIISISLFVLVQRHPGQCTSSSSSSASASAGLCLPGGNSGTAHHQHQLFCACLPATPWQCASSASAGLYVSEADPGRAHHQHQLGCACSQAAQALRIISVSWTVLVGFTASAGLRLFKGTPGTSSSSSAALPGLCLPGGNSGTAHHQHQLVCPCPRYTQAVRIISISWVVLVRRQPRQCASAASAGSC